MPTKFLRVATSGKTVDGREITPAMIDQMAATYDPAKYGARVWMEHIRSFLPDSPFKAYGDVVAVKAMDGDNGTRALLAQLDPTADLIKLAQDRQKVFFSVEIDPNFAGTNQAYLMGLAVTDSPASLGTEMLTFAAKSELAPEAVKRHLFGAAVEESGITVEDETQGLLDKIKGLLASSKTKTEQSPASLSAEAVKKLSDMETGMIEIAATLQDMQKKAGDFSDASTVKTLAEDLAKLNAKLADIETKMSKTPTSQPRQPAAGGNGMTQTDC
jgi:hypothetical protein